MDELTLEEKYEALLKSIWLPNYKGNLTIEQLNKPTERYWALRKARENELSLGG